MSTTQDYITDVQRLLHDASGNFWPTTELLDYINEARRAVALDTGCNRTTLSKSTIKGTDLYLWDLATLGVMDIYIIWGNVRYTLVFKPWSTFNRDFRTQIDLQQVPSCWSNQGRGVYLYPIPNQVYPMEWDVIPVTSNLTNLSNPSSELDGEIYFPYTRLVSFWAAYLARVKSQNYDEAEGFRNLYYAEAFRGGLGIVNRKRNP